jgi:hypothetical protein
MREVFGVPTMAAESPDCTVGFGLFYDWKYALRFELSGEASPPIAAFTRAFFRLQTLLRSVFSEDEEVHPLLRFHDYRKEKHRFKECGFSPPKTFSKEIVRFVDGDGERYREVLLLVPARLGDQNVSAALWASLTKDLHIKPSADLRAYLVSFKRKILIHAYDDRGVDFASPNRSEMQPLFDKHHSWLLAHDLEYMESVFSP